MLLRSHSVCGMLIFPLTGNRNLYTPVAFLPAFSAETLLARAKNAVTYCYYYTLILSKSKRFLYDFCEKTPKNNAVFHPFLAIFLTDVLCSVPESNRHMFFLCAAHVSRFIKNSTSIVAAKYTFFCAP